MAMEEKKQPAVLEPLKTAQEIEQAIEAILFAAGYPVRYDKLAEVLAIGVIDIHHGIVQQPRLLSCKQTVNTRGGLLTAADQAISQLAALAVEQGDKVAAVVDDQIGVTGKGGDQIALVFLGRRAVAGVHTKALGGKRGCTSVVFKTSYGMSGLREYRNTVERTRSVVYKLQHIGNIGCVYAQE